MADTQKNRLTDDKGLSLFNKFETIYTLCIENGSYDEEKARRYIKELSESASTLDISKTGKREGANFITSQGKVYVIGFNGDERLGYYLYLLDEFKAYIHKLSKVEETGEESTRKQSEQPPPDGESINIVRVADVEKKTVSFLIEPYIVKNNITALVGDGGVGKTTVWIDFASAISKGILPVIMGTPEAFNKCNVKGNTRVLYCTSEDRTDTTLKARFEKAGADQTQICFVPMDDKSFHKLTLDSQELAECIALTRPALVILDPLQSFVHGKMSERNNMRRQMDCLTALAQKYDTSFLLVVHTNKMQTTDARTKLSDSSDIWDKCRSVLFVGRTKDGLRYLSQEKGNYTTDENRLDTQLFIIKDGRIEHKGTTDKKYYDFATESTFAHKDTSIKDSAKEFILESLKDGEMVVKELDESAKSFGISADTLKRAKKDLKEENKTKYRADSGGKNKGVVWYISLNTLPEPPIE